MTLQHMGCMACNWEILNNAEDVAHAFGYVMERLEWLYLDLELQQGQ